jgi:tRNA pseudouridine38-40 synthase
MRLAFCVAYLGDRFFGSQVQEGVRTVEGEYIAACQRLGLFSDWKAARFASAGRTDRGVHACGQVIAFSTEMPERAIQVLNHQLPRDCWCRGYAVVDEEFHPRYQARSRTYRYFLCRTLLNVEEMNRAARYFEGTHDFSAFARVEGRNPMRTLHCVLVKQDGPRVMVEVTGESFLWHMVRGIVSFLESVGEGRSTAESVAPLLDHPTDQRIPAAPPEGLVLWEVDCGIPFTSLPLEERHRRSLLDIHRHHCVMEEITGQFLGR